MSDLPKSLADNPRLDAWLGFAVPGRIEVRVGKVEIGQGIVTALAQIAAEELEVDPARLDMLSGDTDRAPDEGTTSSSLSIEVGGAALRLVCAEVRALALAEAARRLNAPVDALTFDDGAVRRSGQATALDYWTLAPALPLDRPASGTIAARPRTGHRVVGTSLPRLDLAGKLAGGGFIHDMTLPGMRHARALRAPRLGARLAACDPAAAERLGAQVLRDGGFVAVVAESETMLRRAHEALAARARWEGGALAPAMAEAAHLDTLPAETRSYGPPAAAHPPGARRHRARFSRPYIAHAALGPSCALAVTTGGRLEVWSHTQGVYPLRNAICATLGIAAERVVVHHAHGAGCYGHNGADDAALDAALVAHMLPGTPIRVLWSREDESSCEPVGTAMSVTLEAVLDDGGRPVDLTTTIVSGLHTGRTPARLLPAMAVTGDGVLPPGTEAPGLTPGAAVRNAEPAYAIPDFRVVHRLVQGTPLRTSSLRGLGALPNVYALEGFLDELAEQADADPLAYRLALLPDSRARAVVERAAAMAGWTRRGPAGTGRGLGIAYARYKNRSGLACVVAEVEAEAEIRVRRIWCAADIGLVVNPDGAIAQLEGGIVQGASMALKEQVTLDEAGVTARDWAGYPILRFSELPEIAVALVDNPDAPPLGVGECSLGPTAAAIGNAASHALGIRLRDMPLTRSRIAAALTAA